jgi:8-oxo-dGTP diphosphatase
MIEVSCAIIINGEKEVLATQRSETMRLPLKWEFPGGKIEKGETAEVCLTREIKEELNIKIGITQSLPATVHSYGDLTIRLIPFVCEIQSGEIELTEHLVYRWLKNSELLDLDWAEADEVILKNYLTSTSI